MHEMPLAEAILETVEARAQGRRVARVRAHVGEQLVAYPEPLRFGFDVAAVGGVCDGATLEIVPCEGEGIVIELIEYRSEDACV
jgi:Zn finger protein HypA/HybF involved in hydrogenase expression